MEDLNIYIKRAHLRALDKFKDELEKYKKECDPEGTLYEDANTPFTVSYIKLENGYLKFYYDGEPESMEVVSQDYETGEYYEDELYNSLMGTIKFWRQCLRRAKRYWNMDTEKLDAIQDGEVEDTEEDED